MDFLPLPNTESGDAVRELTPEEIESYVRPKYEATGNPLPHPSEYSFIGVIRGGQVVAALGVGVKIHAEPLMIDPGYGSVLPALVSAVEKHILSRCGPQYVYLFAPAGRTAQLAQAMGMQLEPWVVMSKLVMPKTPHKTPVELPLPALEEMPAEGGTQ